MEIEKLGDSVFNYDFYSADRFIHYFQQIECVLKLKPNTMLEVGPGDHCVSDFLARKGISVKTFDQDVNLHPDYSGDIRKELNIPERFDLVLASEVLEHFDLKFLNSALANISGLLRDNGHLVISAPYSTLRLFPVSTQRYGRIFSCAGILHTGMPLYFFHPIFIALRVAYRLVVKRESLKRCFSTRIIPEYEENRFDVHHWDLGIYRKTRPFVEETIRKHFNIVERLTYLNTNVIFYICKKRASDSE